ncbi:MAG: alpha-mannosidase [Candidatus Promineifilaceae bacterium]
MSHQQRLTLEKLPQRLTLIRPLVNRQSIELAPFECQFLPDNFITPPQPPEPTGDWTTIPPGSYWGTWNTHFILRSSLEVPQSWAGGPVMLYLPLGISGEFSHPEALVYLDDRPYAACDRHHQDILLSADFCDGRSHTLTIIGWTGRGTDPQTQLLMRTCTVSAIDEPTREFNALARVTMAVLNEINPDLPTYGHLLNALDTAVRALDTREPFDDRFYESVPPALALLQEGIAAAGSSLDVTMTAAGHAHIDVAWLWTLAQTRQKAARTFHTVIQLMKEFPAYTFTQSQPQLYDFIRQDHPNLFKAIQKAVADGRWEAIGGMWVEADCNLSGPESLARQFLLGRTFFREHFGPDAESPILWLPDVFGYAWNLPQLIKQAGLDFFFTIKIGWSRYNRLPYDTFWWQGLDGTKVLTHFSPAKQPWQRSGNYNAEATPGEVLEGWRNFQQKDSSSNILMSYGYGDGGGGPNREMQENLRLLQSFPAMPQVRQGKAIDFYRRIETEAAENSFPTWNGELYLELHRGTYTTQARNKRANRQSEFLLHDAEFLAAYAAQTSPNYDYPHDRLHRAWELVCLNQFHDIVPGSSINQVYVDSLEQYAEVRQLGERVRDEALAALAQAMNCAVVVTNPTAFTRRDLLFWPDGENGRIPDRQTGLTTQSIEGGLLLDVGELPPYAIRPLSQLSSGPIGSLSASSTHLENDFLRVEFNEAGDITQIYDKENGRSVLPPDTIANQWQAFEDRPLAWDAWDIDIFYDDKQWTADPATSITVVESGPLRAAILIERQILNSHYTQRISLAHNSPRLDFATEIEWQERHILLKAAFPVDVLTPTATYEIQWGNVTRPTHRNTSWDWARFETCAQKWVDLSEGNYGVSLLNDCKYGHDIQDKAPIGGVIRLTLLRSPTNPDPEADQGRHWFTYSLLPHHGRWGLETIAHAYALNDPLRLYAAKIPTASAPEPTSRPSLVTVDRPNVIIETIKQAEDGDGLIVRLYEAMRCRGTVTLKTGFPLSAVYQTNLLEENQQPLPHESDQVAFPIKPYQIITLRLLPGDV